MSGKARDKFPYRAMRLNGRALRGRLGLSAGPGAAIVLPREGAMRWQR